MSKITRVNQRIFGSTSGLNQIEQFGSLAGGSPNYTTDPTVIQALSAWLEGWFGGVVGLNNPAIEDMNAVMFVYAYQLAYLFQAGIPEWEVGTTYYTGSFAQVNGVLYSSLQDNNIGHLVSDPAWWTPAIQPTITVFTSSGTFTAGPGVTSVDVIADFPSQGADFNFTSFNDTGNMVIVDPEGNAWSWGEGVSGSLGVGADAKFSSPIAVVGTNIKWRQVVFGDTDSGGGIDIFGNLYTWGLGSFGIRGDGNPSGPVSSPIAVIGTTRFFEICEGFAANKTALALASDGTLWGWGVNGSGQLGTGDIANRSSPTLVLGGLFFKKVINNSGGTVSAVDSAGNAYMWGLNANGQCGLGDVVNRSSPVIVLGGHLWKQILPAYPINAGVTLGLDTAGKLWAWGDNTNGLLGIGTNGNAVSSPVAVSSAVVFTELMGGNWMAAT